MGDKHVMNENPATAFNKEFNTGHTESKDDSANKVLLTLSGNSKGTVGDKFHGYDHNDKSVNY